MSCLLHVYTVWCVLCANVTACLLVCLPVAGMSRGRSMSSSSPTPTMPPPPTRRGSLAFARAWRGVRGVYCGVQHFGYAYALNAPYERRIHYRIISQSHGWFYFHQWACGCFRLQQTVTSPRQTRNAHEYHVDGIRNYYFTLYTCSIYALHMLHVIWMSWFSPTRTWSQYHWVWVLICRPDKVAAESIVCVLFSIRNDQR